MEDSFFRFPSIPHIKWLGEDLPRDDKLLSDKEVRTLLSGEIVAEEKLDGANIGISFDAEGNIQVQNRGQYLLRPFVGQFEKLENWLESRENQLFDTLGENLILFGEWCAAKHSIAYTKLPDWFLVFDVFDKRTKMFWSTNRRNKLAEQLKLIVVPQLLKGKFKLTDIIEKLNTYKSFYRDGAIEGFIIRKENKDQLSMRGKIVKSEFVQNIGEHWSKKKIEWNHIDWEKAYDSQYR